VQYIVQECIAEMLSCGNIIAVKIIAIEVVIDQVAFRFAGAIAVKMEADELGKAQGELSPVPENKKPLAQLHVIVLHVCSHIIKIIAQVSAQQQQSKNKRGTAENSGGINGIYPWDYYHHHGLKRVGVNQPGAYFLR